MYAGGSMRTVAHPGMPLQPRLCWVTVRTARPMRLTIAAGEDLFATIHDTLESLGAPGGAFVMVGGAVARLTLMTGGPGDSGPPMRFYGPHVLAAPLVVVAGAGGSGVDEDGTRFSHCHAAFRDAAGRCVGGHLMPGETIAGRGGMTVDVVPLLGGCFRRRLDPETSFTIFHPDAA